MARVPLVYPKIPGSRHSPEGHCIAFEKYDGTNLHWVWERELGWYAFGTRRDRFDLDAAGIADFSAAHAGLEDAPALFRAEWADPLEEIFRRPPYDCAAEIRVFTEYVGPNSFAGTHQPDDPKRLVLFDVETDAEGLVGPERFVADFGHLPIAQVIHRGRLTGRFIHDVREGRYPVGEGVVCKGGTGGADLWMVKVKTLAYKERTQKAFGDAWINYWE